MVCHRLQIFLTLLLVLLLGMLLAFHLPVVTAAVPGSAEDPLVTRSYLENYVDQAFAPLDQQLDRLLSAVGSQQIVLTIGSTTAAVNGQNVTLNTAPQIMGSGYTLVPARFIGETLGLAVEWNANTRIVSFSGTPGRMSLQVGSTTATINGQSYEMNYPAVIVNGHTLVHVRFISESFNCRVEWNPTTRQVTITK